MQVSKAGTDREDRVYIISPDLLCRMNDGPCGVASRNRRVRVMRAIDLFFRDLATMTRKTELLPGGSRVPF